MTSPAQRRKRIGWGIGLALAGAVIGMVIGWVVALQYEGERDAAKAGEAQAEQKVDAGINSLEAGCAAGYRWACDAADSIGDVDDPEEQDFEIQEPEFQEPEIQDPEVGDAERQDAELQDAEDQELEEQEGEIQDPETDDPDPDDPETQDPEIDDPDPNSALEYAFRDECNPPDGHHVTDTGGYVERSGGTVTFVSTCTTAPAAAPGNPGGNP